MDESGDRLVYAWLQQAPDPRQDPSLRPTGDFARVTDRLGVKWTVYELEYDGRGSAGDRDAPPGAGPFHAYAVGLGPVRTLEDGSSYNHVLTYRPDRLVAPFQEAETGKPDPAADPRTEAGPDTWAARGVIEAEPALKEYPMSLEVGPAPQGLGT